MKDLRVFRQEVEKVFDNNITIVRQEDGRTALLSQHSDDQRMYNFLTNKEAELAAELFVTRTKSPYPLLGQLFDRERRNQRTASCRGNNDDKNTEQPTFLSEELHASVENRRF